MAYRGDEQLFNDFSGGMMSNKPAHSIPPNGAALVQNIVLCPGGGFRKRNGDTEFNGTAMGDPSAVTGLGYYKPSSGTEYLMAVSKDGIYKSEMDGTMDTITGAVTVTAAQNNTWTFTQMNDLAIFVGGAPNPPFKWNATGNAAVLGGSPPSGSFGFQVNNRMFIGNIASYNSRIQWSILSNPEDWSGTGSGSADVWTNDGDTLTTAAVLSSDVVLLFKNNSIHQMVARTAPFPIFPLFANIGCCGKFACTVYNGVAYFITSDAKIRATDGNQIIDMGDDNVDDILSTVNMTRLKYAVVSHQQGDGYNHILFMLSSSSASANDICLIWDLSNKCWLYHPTGYACNVVALTQQKVLYGGHINGKIYKKDVASTYSDASTSTGVIDGLWRWGWMSNNSFMYASRPNKLTVSLATQTTGSVKVAYGFDYNTDTNTDIIDQKNYGAQWGTAIWNVSTWGGSSNIMRTVFLNGMGNTFQCTIRNNNLNETMKVNGFSLGFKKQAQREMTAS